jgi:hypothetical protein
LPVNLLKPMLVVESYSALRESHSSQFWMYPSLQKAVTLWNEFEDTYFKFAAACKLAAGYFSYQSSTNSQYLSMSICR